MVKEISMVDDDKPTKVPPSGPPPAADPPKHDPGRPERRDEQPEKKPHLAHPADRPLRATDPNHDPGKPVLHYQLRDERLRDLEDLLDDEKS